MSSLPKKLPTISSTDRRRVVLAALLVAALMPAAGCDIHRPSPLITVYNPQIAVSVPVPVGWRSESTSQAGFVMQSFTGMSVDVPDRPGIRAQVMAGPTPAGADLEKLAERYRGELNLVEAQDYELASYQGRTWEFLSEDGDESSRLMLIDIEGRLYGLFVRGEARTLTAYGSSLKEMWDGFAVERGEFFEVYEAPGQDLTLKHPRSWERTSSAASPGHSLFVGFRSPPLAVEKDGTTVHATLEVTVNRVPPETTVESFYALRAEELGDNYRLLRHEAMPATSAISTLYHVETQLAQYLERTIYVVKDEKSYIYKFNCRPQLYRAIEGWIDEIVANLGLS